MACIPDKILLGWSDEGGWDGRITWYVWRRREMHTGFWFGNLEERDRLPDLDLDGRMKALKWIWKKQGASGSRYGQSGWLLWTHGVSWLANETSAFQEGICCRDLGKSSSAGPIAVTLYQHSLEWKLFHADIESRVAARVRASSCKERLTYVHVSCLLQYDTV